MKILTDVGKKRIFPAIFVFSPYILRKYNATVKTLKINKSDESQNVMILEVGLKFPE